MYIVAAIVASVCGCAGALSTREVELVLPKPLPGDTTVLRKPAYRIEWRDFAGEPRWMLVTDDERVVVRLPKRSGVAVLAYPLYPNLPSVFRPAGAVFPDTLDESGRLVLSWRDGFLAQRYHRLSGLSVPLERVNTPKLRRRIDFVAGDDPWVLDAEALETAIADSTLAAASVRRREARQVTFKLEPGTWIRSSALAPMLLVGSDGTGEMTACLGYHPLVHLDTGRMLSLSIGEEGTVSIVATWPRY